MGLARLTLAALYYHADLDIARADLAAAKAGVTIAGERPNPTLNLTALVATNAVAGAITPGAAPLEIGPVIDFVLETADKREYRSAGADTSPMPRARTRPRRHGRCAGVCERR